MAPSNAAKTGGVEILAEEECRRLLGSRTLGRLAMVVSGWPQILPVNYAFTDGAVVIRTDAGLKLDETQMKEVAFETDEVNEAAGTAWSVMVQGTAYDITETLDSRSERLRHAHVEPQAPGDRDHWMGIYVHRISGRRFKLNRD